MSIFVANTDHDWFDFLSAQRDVDEVNFWMPNPWHRSGTFRVLERGELLLFHLKAPLGKLGTASPWGAILG